MPFAEDFDAAAAALDAAAEQTTTLVEPARATMSSGAMTGGQLTDVVTDELDAATALLDQAGAELRELAATCRERAEICRQALGAQQAYTESYAGYEAELRDRPPGAEAEPPAPPVPPPAPPPWANR